MDLWALHAGLFQNQLYGALDLNQALDSLLQLRNLTLLTLVHGCLSTQVATL